MSNEIKLDNVAKHIAQVARVLPAYVVEDHERFTSFMKHYYEWSSTEGPAAALNYLKVNNDVDFVIDEMLDSYASLFAKNLPINMKGDYRFFIKFMKQFYEVKGSEESYKILYKALFDAEVSVYFPKRSLFATSCASWARERQFRVRYSGDGYDLRGRLLTGEDNGFKCLVSDVMKKDDVWIVFPQNETGAFNANEKIDIEGIDEYAYIQSVYEIDSITSNATWYDNDIIHLSNEIIAKVDKIYYGSIESISLIDGGTGYTVGDIIYTESDYSGTGFKAKVLTVDPDGTVLTISLLRSGFGYVSDKTIRFIGGTGAGIDLALTWDSKFKTIQSASLISTKNKDSVVNEVFTTSTGDVFTLKQGVYVQPKYWKVIRGAPSTQTARIQDSSYYQEFSYVLSSNASAKEHEVALKNILEIAGLKLFIEQSVGDIESIQSQDQLLVEIF